MVDIGVIGTGNIGTDHVRRIVGRIARARVVAVHDVDADRASEVAREAGARSLPRAQDVIDDAGVEALIVATPGETHARYVLSCLASAKPVLCEKPLATTSEDCLRVLEAEEAAGRRLVQVGFMRRYDVGYRRVKQAIDDGSIGVPLVVHCVHRNPAAPPGFTSAMVMTDSVIHEIDCARWLLGEEIVAATVIRSRPSPLVQAPLRDPQLVLLEGAGGVVVEVEAFVNARYGYDVRCEVVGSLGFATLDNPSTGALATDGRRAQPIPADWRVRFGQAFADEIQAWVDGLAEGTVGGPNAWDGYAATAVATACVRSLESGARSTVDLVERPAFYA